MSGIEKQNHKYRTTAITLRRYHQDDDSKNLAGYIEKIDMWFNVSNSLNSSKAKLEFKKSYIGSSCQKQALDDMSHLMLHSWKTWDAHISKIHFDANNIIKTVI
uniref:Uncharacterized protein n=1 Tax=Anopheles funestus TaxID=62324 RepID=A0A182RUM9_ANOFN